MNFPSSLTGERIENFIYPSLKVSISEIQNLVDTFWDRDLLLDERIYAFESIKINERWDIIQDLFMYLWRNNFNEDMEKDMELRKIILLDPILIHELSVRYNMKDRLRKAWYHNNDAHLSEFQEQVLSQFT